MNVAKEARWHDGGPFLVTDLDHHGAPVTQLIVSGISVEGKGVTSSHAIVVQSQASGESVDDVPITLFDSQSGSGFVKVPEE